MDLTPMVDVTFLLLIFFMITASFTLQKTIQVPTPDDSKRGARQSVQTVDDMEATSIIVKIDPANAILVDDEPMPRPEGLADLFRDKMARERKNEVVISAHALSLHRVVIGVIDAANAAGIQKIGLITRSGG